MKKGFILSGLLALSITACSTPIINTTHDFSDLEKEYKSFSTKALSDAYVKRMFGKYISESNSQHLARQIEFSRFLKNNGDTSYENSLKSMFFQAPSLYNQLTGITAISTKITSESATFGSFVHGLSPYAASPVAENASNITISSFTANWSSVNNATGYTLTVIQGATSTDYTLGNVTTYNITGLPENTPYSYYVKATNANGTSFASNSVNVNTLIANYVYPVSTIAGSSQGYIDAQGTNALFYYPNHLTVDNSGTIYVTDTNNHCIRKITSSGIVSTVAGTGSASFADGSGTNASFSSPYGIVEDSNGNLYVADTYNYKIRKIDTFGNVTTIAGSTTGDINSNGTNAKFKLPIGLTTDNSGNLFIADYGNHKIKKIDTSGNVTTVAGSTSGFTDGLCTNAQFNNPESIIRDTSGNIYVSDYGNNSIRKIDASGNVSTVAGDGIVGTTDASGTFARFSLPEQLTTDNAGNLYVADYGSNRIRKINSVGNVTTIAGSSQGFANDYGTNAKFYLPTGIAMDSNGNLYVSDRNNNRIRKINITTQNLLPLAPVATTAGNINAISFTANWNVVNNATGYILTLTQGSNITEYNTGNVTSYNLTNLSPKTNYSYTVKAINSNGFGNYSNFVSVNTNEYTVTTIAGNGTAGFFDGPATSAQFSNPLGLDIDNSGNIYVADQSNNRIRKITPAGIVSTLAGDGTIGDLNGTGTLARFNLPVELETDSSGNVYVADQGNNTIRKITPDGVVSKLAGGYAALYGYGFLDGDVSSSRFRFPVGIDVDNSGNVYVGDRYNQRIRKISSSGIVSSIAGNATPGIADGSGTSAMFNYPMGVNLDNSGNIYVADQGNNLIRKVTPSGVVTTLAGSMDGASGNTDATGTNAKFNYPTRLAVDSFGNVFVADLTNYVVRRITPSGVVTTIAGSKGIAGSTDGTGTNAKFYSPYGIAIDSSGNIYVSENGNCRIRKIQP